MSAVNLKSIVTVEEARAGLYLRETKEAFVTKGTASCLRTGHLTYGRILLTTPKLWEYTYSGLACGSWSHLKGAVVRYSILLGVSACICRADPSGIRDTWRRCSRVCKPYMQAFPV